MAVPARKTSKMKKRTRRTHQQIKSPTIAYDLTTGNYKRSHYITKEEVKKRKAEVR